jgi:2,4-dienoyl-CoA reductase-like NADH-dependent reductase (Old Yellow Enzyme family)
MGLDISFNRKKAEEAGLVITTGTNGTENDRAAAVLSDDDQGYIAWLHESVETVHVPNTQYSVVAETFHSGEVAIRANKWGRVYKPMTDWLRTHKINWEEL